jgi:hypothetical protein
MTAPSMPWRVLVLDASGDDPVWLLASVTIASDVRPAIMEGRRYADWTEVTAWVRHQAGRQISLIPVTGMVWRVQE